MSLEMGANSRTRLLKQFIVAWYRENGNHCPYSVWRVLTLVRVYLELEPPRTHSVKVDAELYAPKVLRGWSDYLLTMEELSNE